MKPVSAKPQKVSAEDRVPVPEKIAYGAGGVAGGIQTYAENAVLNPVFVVACGISPATMSLAALIYRLWDAVTDALMGWVTDNTRSRWGRRKPYILFGGIAMGLAMPVAFFFDRSWSLTTITVWMIASQLLAFLFVTVWNIPYQCMLMEITRDSNERTNVAAWRAYFSKATSLVVGWVWFLTQLPIFHDPTTGKADTINGARWVISGCALIVIGLALLPLFVRKRVDVGLPAGKPSLPLRENLGMTFQSRPFVILVVFSLLFTLGIQLKGGLDFYTRLYYVCDGDQKLASTITGFGSTIITFTGLAGIPAFQWIANHHGKKFALTIVMGIVFCASLSTFVFYTPAMPYLSMLPGILLAPASSALWVLIPSMTGDIIDHDELLNDQRRDGSFTSVYSWTYKFSISTAVALSGPLVVWAGFDAQIGDHQPADVLWRMRLLLILVPAVFIGSAIWLLSRYPLTTSRIEEVRAALAARRPPDLP